MERDIRNLFEDDQQDKPKLPENHREEFFEKLNKIEVKTTEKKYFFILKIAAVIILIFCAAYFYVSDTPSIKKIAKTDIQIQMELFEKEYLTHIDKEWKSFIKVANDTILIKKYEVKIKESVTDYKKITEQLNDKPESILILELLIENLQRRLQLVKDIKEHIKELNQKNTSNETIYL